MNIPRPEYPRPQFVREQWLNLNGPWSFEIDAGDSGLERGLLWRELSQQILVPFCPESKLSGIGNIDFLNAVWYRRDVKIPGDWAGKRVLLHLQACDYDTTIWVNGKEITRHRGGWSTITCDLHGVAKAGENITITVRARDDHRQPKAKGKQSDRYENYGCSYVRTTGIWQTVWMEPVPDISLRRPRITPDVGNHAFHLTQPITQNAKGYSVRAILRDGQQIIADVSTPADAGLAAQLSLPIPEKHVKLWSPGIAPGQPFLYDMEIQLRDENKNVIDKATSYAGLRSVSIEDKKVLINGKSIFQRLVLDQGYYPDGILTAPSDAALVRDIELSLTAGFNGARLHQKVFEERFLFHADRMGYLCWGEFGDWSGDWGFTNGNETNNRFGAASYVTQWLEILHRDYSHPCIIGWCPLNETMQKISDHISPLDDVMLAMFLATKAIDTTRPALDTSGYSHRVIESDIYDSHDYEQDPVKFAEHHANCRHGQPHVNTSGPHPVSIAYRGQPFFVSEFGGIWWNPNVRKDEPSWGYGNRPKSVEEFHDRFTKLCAVLLDDPSMFGYCYTQLTDVFQEQNGIYHFDRASKFDMARIRAAQTKQAAIEK